jgi:hypothetical protein
MAKKQKEEPKTAEEYLAKAEALKQEYKSQWKTFLKCGIFTLAAVFVLILLTVAWYTNNATTDVKSGGVSADNVSFQLKSYGSKSGVFDDDILSNSKLSNLFNSITVWAKSMISGDDDSNGNYFYSTSDSSSSISWLVSPESNLGNYSSSAPTFVSESTNQSTESGNESSDNSKIDTTVTSTDRKDYAIEPGSNGELTFYIIPSKSGTQTFNLNLNIIPYYATVDEKTGEITSAKEVGASSDSTSTPYEVYARNFISGHILFFLENEDESVNTTSKDDNSSDEISNDTDDSLESTIVVASDSESDASEEASGEQSSNNAASSKLNKLTWIKDGDFSIKIENAEAGKEYKYTIYWSWTQVFAELVLTTGDKYLNSNKVTLPEDIRALIVEDLVTNPEKYFYNSLTKKPLDNSSDLVSGLKGIKDIYDNSPVTTGDNAYSVQNFVDLSSFYNQADQIIGSNVHFIVAELTAVPGGDN